MSDGNEARANLQKKLAQACRLLQQITDAKNYTEPQGVYCRF